MAYYSESIQIPKCFFFENQTQETAYFLHRLSYLHTYLLLLFRSEYNVLHTCYIFIVCMCSTISNLIEVLISFLRNLLFPFTCNTIPKFACDWVSFPLYTYSCVFSTSHTVIGDMTNFYEKLGCITRHVIPFNQRPGCNTEPTYFILM